MKLWGFNRKLSNAKRKRALPSRRNRVSADFPQLSLEPLESRHLLTVTLSPIAGNDANSAFDVPAGKDLYVPLTASDPGHTVSYTATSSNSQFSVSVLSGNPTLELTVQGVDNDGNSFSGTLTIELFQDLAPDTVATIEGLVNSGFYDGLSFYRIVPNFVAQGGANGSKTADTFDDEFNANLTFNSPGLLAMANPGTANSNTSEFFITDIDLPTDKTPQYLNFRHTIFGQLTSGFDLYQSIMNAQGVTGSNSSPTTPVTITSAKIIDDTQNGVLQIEEPDGFTGSATITVLATSTDGSTATQTFTVVAAPPTATSSTQPLFINTIDDLVTQQDTSVSFQISAEQFYSNGLTYTISGTDSFNSTPQNVTVQVTDNGDNTATVTLTPASGFAGTIHLVAHADDAVYSLHDAQEFTLTVAAELTIDTVTSPVNASNQSSTSISGTGTPGDSISVVVTDGTNTTSTYTSTVASDGTWGVAAIDVSTLNDGTITYTVKSDNGGGNTSEATKTSTKDTVAPVVSITSWSDLINLAQSTNTDLSGTGEVGASVSVVVTDGTNSTSAYTTTVSSNGTWTINGIDVSSLNDGTITYTATVTDTAGNSAEASETSTKDVAVPTLEITSVTNPVTLANVSNTEASGTSEAGATITVKVTDTVNTTIEYTTTVDQQGNWSISGIDVSTLNDGNIFFVVTASDEAGNTVSASKNASKGAIVISLVTDPVNLANENGVSVSGTGEAGITVSLVVSDGANSTDAYTTTIGENGTWSIDGIDVSSLNDGTLTFKATGTDSQNNFAEFEKTAEKDTVPPEIFVTSVTDPVNAASAASTSAVGTSEAGAVVSVVATDGTNTTTAYTATVSENGSWTVDGIDVTSLADGTITYVVTVTDSAGNNAETSMTAIKDTVAPNVAIGTVTDPINIADSGGVSASGTGEVGATISVVVTDGTNTTTPVTTTVGQDGTWSVSGIDVSPLADGTITYTVTATDAVGNSADDSSTATKATITVTVVTDPVNAANANSVSASGTGEVGATVTLVVTDGTNTTSTYAATIGSDGTWSINSIDVSGLNDGTLTFTATATDGDNNTASSSKSTTMDTVAPSVVISSVTDPVDSTNDTAVSINGTGEAGAAIAVVASDGSNVSTSYTTTVASDGTWSISAIDVSGLNDGTITFTATATDAAENAGTTSTTAIKGSTATGSLSGVVYNDSNHNGVQDSTDPTLAGILITLNGVDLQGNPLPTRTTTTASDGTYSFSDLPAGTYSISQAQSYALKDGSATQGSLGGTAATNIISAISLGAGESGTGYNFSESGLISSMVSLRMFMSSSLASTTDFYSGYVSKYGTTAPVVASIVKADADPTSATQVTFTVTFNQSVTGVDSSDFKTIGDSTAHVSSVTGSGTTYTVTVYIGGASGTVGLKLTDDDTILGELGNSLGGDGTSNGDFVGPYYTISAAAASVSVSAVTDPINATNESSVAASGTGEAGATIKIVATDGTNSSSEYTATAASDGSWSVSGIDVSSLADGTITFTVTSTIDGAVTSTATKTATKDTVAPTVAVTDVTDPVNADSVANAQASGTGEAGATVSLVVSDGTNSSTEYSTTVLGDGTWSISGINVSGLDDGTITFAATATDTAGNTAEASLAAEKDTVAPAVTLAEATDPLTIANHKSASASGTGEIGATITLVVTDGQNSTTTYTTSVDANGNWSIDGIDTSALTDGTVTYKVTAADAAGNTAEDTLTAAKLSVAVSSVTDPINAENADAVSISGTGEVGATVAVVITDGTTTLDSLTTVIAEDGTWSIANINVTSLADGVITFQVAATDVNDHAAEITVTANKDTVAPDGAITSVTDPINADSADSVTASGTGEAGATVTLVASDGQNSTTTYTAQISGGGTWTIEGIDVSGLSDGTITFDATVTDTAGNTTQVTDTGTKDTVAPTVQILTVADPITIANHKSLDLGGTGEVGATISLVVTDGTNGTSSYTTAVDENGNWAITGIDTTGLADGTLAFQVTTTDVAGNSAAGSVDVQKSTVAISAIDAINSQNAADFTVSGTGEVGATITLVATDGTNSTTEYQATVGEGGTWTIVGIDVSALADGEITFNVTATDSLDNTAQTSSSAVKDTVAPELAFVGVTSPINAANATSVSASGTGEVGATIRLVATDGTYSTTEYTTTVAEDGTWTIDGIDVSSLTDGTITFDVTATDAVGNPATSSLSTDKDTIAPAIAIGFLTSPIDTGSQTSTQVNGTGEAGATVSVVASDGTNSTAAYATTIAEDGTWAVSDIDVSGLLDGTITYTATATDAAGNSAQATISGTKQTVAITSVTDPINADSSASVDVSGTGTVGDTISLVVSDAQNTTSAVTTTVGQDGTWQISGVDVSALNDGTLTFMATATNTGSGTTQTTLTAVKDTVAPSVSITDVTDPINASNASAVSVSGTGEVGATVSVSVTDGTTTTDVYTTVVQEDGSWTIDNIDVTGLSDAELTFTVTAADAAGNAAQISANATKDTIAPAVAITSVTDPIGSDTASSVSIVGTGEAGDSISVIVSDSGSATVTATAPVGEDSTWSLTGIDVSSLADGTLTFAVTATDNAGNSTSTSTTADKSTSAEPLSVLDKAFSEEDYWL